MHLWTCAWLVLCRELWITEYFARIILKRQYWSQLLSKCKKNKSQVDPEISTLGSSGWRGMKVKSSSPAGSVKHRNVDWRRPLVVSEQYLEQPWIRSALILSYWGLKTFKDVSPPVSLGSLSQCCAAAVLLKYSSWYPADAFCTLCLFICCFC